MLPSLSTPYELKLQADMMSLVILLKPVSVAKMELSRGTRVTMVILDIVAACQVDRVSQFSDTQILERIQ
jgi:hypothetical protein